MRGAVHRTKLAESEGTNLTLTEEVARLRQRLGTAKQREDTHGAWQKGLLARVAKLARTCSEPEGGGAPTQAWVHVFWDVENMVGPGAARCAMRTR